MRQEYDYAAQPPQRALGQTRPVQQRERTDRRIRRMRRQRLRNEGAYDLACCGRLNKAT